MGVAAAQQREIEAQHGRRVGISAQPASGFDMKTLNLAGRPRPNRPHTTAVLARDAVPVGGERHRAQIDLRRPAHVLARCRPEPARASVRSPGRRLRVGQVQPSALLDAARNAAGSSHRAAARWPGRSARTAAGFSDWCCSRRRPRSRAQPWMRSPTRARAGTAGRPRLATNSSACMPCPADARLTLPGLRTATSSSPARRKQAEAQAAVTRWSAPAAVFMREPARSGARPRLRAPGSGRAGRRRWRARC